MEFDLTHTNNIHLPHLSPSTVNSFIGSRFGFYQSKVKGAPFAGNQYTARGTAVEHAVNTWIETPNHLSFVNAALEKFDEEIKKAGLSRMAVEDERDTIPGLVDLALGFYKREFATHKAITQRKVECQLDGLERIMVGYLDYFQMGIAVRDSKVVSKTPSKLSQAYVLQGAFYRKATGLNVTFDFFIPNKTPVQKSITLSDDEYVFGLSYLTAASKVIEEIERCDSPARMMELMSFPNLDSMYSVPEKKEAARLWGIAY